MVLNIFVKNIYEHWLRLPNAMVHTIVLAQTACVNESGRNGK